MRRVTLNGGIEISQLCFGTANLGRLDSKRAVLRMLEAAYAAGITHFDTARLYGHGTMEGMVGQFLHGKRDRVTVTTKFGLDPLLRSGRLRPLLNAAKFVIKGIPLLRRKAAQMARSKVSVPDRREQYSKARAERALTESLRELRTDYIDIYLLHEADPDADVSADLLNFLQERKAAGVIRAIGIGSASSTLLTASPAARARQDVLQFDSNVWQDNRCTLALPPGPSLITHGVFQALSRLVETAQQHPEVTARHATALGSDPPDLGNMSAWMLKHALQVNAAGGVLVSTINSARLLDNVRVAESPPTAAATAAFAAYVDELREAK